MLFLGPRREFEFSFLAARWRYLLVTLDSSAYSIERNREALPKQGLLTRLAATHSSFFLF